MAKPDFMSEGRTFDPATPVARGGESYSLRLSVLSGRHLGRQARGAAACNAFVRLEVVGCQTDCAYANTAIVQVWAELQGIAAP